MAQFHTLTLTVEDFRQEDFDNATLRSFAQELADYATKRARALGLDSGSALVTYAREGDDDGDYEYLESFDGRA